MSGFCCFLFTISSIYKTIYCRWWKDTMDSGGYSGYNILTWQRKQSRPRKQLTRSQREDDRDTLLRKAKFRKRVFCSISQFKTKWSSVHNEKKRRQNGLRCKTCWQLYFITTFYQLSLCIYYSGVNFTYKIIQLSRSCQICFFKYKTISSLVCNCSVFCIYGYQVG